jgi:mono/diheme cytochrome c family protein
MRSTALALLLIAGLSVTACGGGSESQAPASETTAPAAPAAAAPAAPAVEYKTVADVFPDGPEKALVLNNCASCHNVACSAIGQRNSDRWNSLRDSHRERVSGADVDAIFAYLKTNFGPDKPEPKMPPAFLEGGCTPF